jgi:hypothetical protein
MRAALIALAHIVAGTAMAQAVAPDTARPCEFPEVVASWSRPPASLATVRERSDTDAAGRVGQPYRVRLVPCVDRWCKPGGRAAMVKIDIPKSGRWRVALDTRAWIDVWTRDRKLDGVLCEHHGCKPLQKIVQYDLAAGPHWVVLEGQAEETGLLLERVSD